MFTCLQADVVQYERAQDGLCGVVLYLVLLFKTLMKDYLNNTQRTRLPPFVLRHSGIMSFTLPFAPILHSGPDWVTSPLKLSSTKTCAL